MVTDREWLVACPCRLFMFVICRYLTFMFGRLSYPLVSKVLGDLHYRVCLLLRFFGQARAPCVQSQLRGTYQLAPHPLSVPLL